MLRRGSAGVAALLLAAVALQPAWGGGGVGRDSYVRATGDAAPSATAQPAKEAAQRARGSTAAVEASGAALAVCPMDRHDVEERDAANALVCTHLWLPTVTAPFFFFFNPKFCANGSFEFLRFPFSIFSLHGYPYIV